MDNYTTLVDVLIKDECAGNPRHEQVLLLGGTPEYLIKYVGFPDISLAVKGSVISKAYFDHGITTSLLKKMPEVVAAPKCVFKSANPNFSDSVVVLTFEMKGLAPIIIPIRQNQCVGRGVRFNLISSIYAKEGPNPEAKWTKSGLLLWKS